MKLHGTAPRNGPTRAMFTEGPHQGKPAIVNKNGVYVLDTAALKQKQKEEEITAKEKALAAKTAKFKEEKKTFAKTLDDIKASANAVVPPPATSTRIPPSGPPPAADTAANEALEKMRAACFLDDDKE